jgi:hypothetical protein
MTVRVDDKNHGMNSGNNSDQFELVLESQQDMTVKMHDAAEACAFQTDKLSLTIVGPLEWSEFLEAMRAISKE